MNIRKINKILAISLAAMLIGFQAQAADAYSQTWEQLVSSDAFMWGILALEGFLIFMALALLVVVYKVKNILDEKYAPETDAAAETVAKTQSIFVTWYERANAFVPAEKEKDILLDHDYDGIQELDNNLPPWWKLMFNLTIVFALVYVGYFHLFNMGSLSDEEYQIEMAEAKVKTEQFMAKKSNLIDEMNVMAVTEDAALAKGKTVYDQNCSACHGKLGEGGIGPNMTDAYWLHGGDVKDIFKTIKYGVPEKGMISWKTQLTPTQMQQVSSFILTLQGTNPPNAKEPQGQLYERTVDPQNVSETPAATQDVVAN